jgi:hypothetical protein
LGKWVAKQREQYHLYREGKHSFLTEERIDLLIAADFTWQIKGRGMTKGKPNKTPHPVKAEKKSLAKMEIIEEDGQGVMSDVDSSISEEEAVSEEKAVAEEEAVEPVSSHFTKGTESDPNQAMPPDMPPTMPPLPSITQQQLLQANMDAIAAHASNKQMEQHLLQANMDAIAAHASNKQMEQHLLQANMDAIAAHASNKQMVAAQLAAVLGFGGGANSNAIPLGDSTFAAMMAHLDESGSYRV